MDGQAPFAQLFAGKPVLTGDTVITLCTSVMRQWARKYMCQLVMLVDFTFRTNQHGYSLFTILAVSSHNHGVPVCFRILKSESTASITARLEQLRCFLDEDVSPSEPLL